MNNIEPISIRPGGLQCSWPLFRRTKNYFSAMQTSISSRNWPLLTMGRESRVYFYRMCLHLSTRALCSTFPERQEEFFILSDSAFIILHFSAKANVQSNRYPIINGKLAQKMDFALISLSSWPEQGISLYARKSCSRKQAPGYLNFYAESGTPLVRSVLNAYPVHLSEGRLVSTPSF